MKNSRNLALKVLGLAVIAALAGQGAVLAADFEAGMNYFRSGKYVEAAAEFQALVEEQPEYDYGYFILGHSFLKMNKNNDAIENFRKAIDLNGDKFEYHYGLAGAYSAAGNYQGALKALNAAEPLVGPNGQAFHTLRGTANYQLKKWSDAIADLEKTVAGEKTAAKKARTYAMIGQAYDELRNYDQAADAFKKSNDLDSSLTTQKLLILSLTNAAGQAQGDAAKQRLYDRAYLAAKEAAGQAPKDFDVVNMMGRAALGAKKYSEAIRAFDQALGLKSDYCPAMVNKGKTFVAMEDWKSAEAAIKKAASCDSDLAFTCHELLGFTYRKMGPNRLEDALAAYEKARSIKNTASIAQAIDEVKQNIEVRDHNAAASEEERRMAEEARKAEEEFRKQQEKVQEWEKKREDQ